MNNIGRQAYCGQMNRNRKKSRLNTWILICVIICLMLSLVGCNDETKKTYAPGTVLSETDTTIELVDMAGRVVTSLPNPCR